jgi:hypothetical protein
MTKEHLEKIKEIKQAGKKDKPFKNLSAKEKDELLETLCRMMGLLPQDAT